MSFGDEIDVHVDVGCGVFGAEIVRPDEDVRTGQHVLVAQQNTGAQNAISVVDAHQPSVLLRQDVRGTAVVDSHTGREYAAGSR